MKFKIGQKVRIKEWMEMPQHIKSAYMFTPPSFTGQHVIIDSIDCFESRKMKEPTYIVNFVDKSRELEDGSLVFESELKPVIEIGEQLLFDFMLE